MAKPTSPVRIPKETLRRLRLIAVLTSTTMQQILDDLITQKLNEILKHRADEIDLLNDIRSYLGNDSPHGDPHEHSRAGIDVPAGASPASVIIVEEPTPQCTEFGDPMGHADDLGTR